MWQSVVDGVTGPDDSLQQLKISSFNQNETSFIRDRCCHLTRCLQMIESN